MKTPKGCTFKLLFTGIFLLGVCGGVAYMMTLVTDSVIVQVGTIIACGFVWLAVLVLLAVRILSRQNVEVLFENMRQHTRPVLSYLGRVLSKSEENTPKAETIINSSMLLASGTGHNVKVSLDTSKKSIVPYVEMQHSNQSHAVDRTPVVHIRPFYFANYGKSIAVGLYLSLNGEKLSFRSDAVLEPNSKVQFEVNDSIKFNKNLKEFSLTYADVYGNEYTVILDGIIEFSEEESLRLDREVYYFYVDAFLEA